MLLVDLTCTVVSSNAILHQRPYQRTTTDDLRSTTNYMERKNFRFA